MPSVWRTDIAYFTLCLRIDDHLVGRTGYTLSYEPEVPATLEIGLKIHKGNGMNSIKPQAFLFHFLYLAVAYEFG